MDNLERKAYVMPRLTEYGTIAALTGDWPCWHDKTFGLPSDTNWKFLPITDCPAGGGS